MLNQAPFSPSRKDFDFSDLLGISYSRLITLSGEVIPLPIFTKTNMKKTTNKQAMKKLITAHKQTAENLWKEFDNVNMDEGYFRIIANTQLSDWQSELKFLQRVENNIDSIYSNHADWISGVQLSESDYDREHNDAGKFVRERIASLQAGIKVHEERLGQ